MPYFKIKWAQHPALKHILKQHRTDRQWRHLAQNQRCKREAQIQEPAATANLVTAGVCRGKAVTVLSPLLLHYKEQRLQIVDCSGKGQQLENRVDISLQVGWQYQGFLLLPEVKKETKLYIENEMWIHCSHYLKGNWASERNNNQFIYLLGVQAENLARSKSDFPPTDLIPLSLKQTGQRIPRSYLPFQNNPYSTTVHAYYTKWAVSLCCSHIWLNQNAIIAT